MILDYNCYLFATFTILGNLKTAKPLQAQRFAYVNYFTSLVNYLEIALVQISTKTPINQLFLLNFKYNLSN